MLTAILMLTSASQVLSAQKSAGGKGPCAGPGQAMAINRIVGGAIGNLNNRSEQVVREPKEWQLLWKKLGLPLQLSAAPPEIDFKTSMVLAVSSGAGEGIVEVLGGVEDGIASPAGRFT